MIYRPEESERGVLHASHFDKSGKPLAPAHDLQNRCLSITKERGTLTDAPHAEHSSILHPLLLFVWLFISNSILEADEQAAKLKTGSGFFMVTHSLLLQP